MYFLSIYLHLQGIFQKCVYTFKIHYLIPYIHPIHQPIYPLIKTIEGSIL